MAGQGFLDIAITPSVRAAQTANGSREIVERANARRKLNRFDEATAAFIATRDSFYLATVSETGWPYIQHRGGPPGFLKVLDEKTLAFADFRGNRQYISLGNIAAEDRVSLFLMDYPHRTRLKIFARMETRDLDADPELAARVAVPDRDTAGYDAKIERVFVLHVEAFDWNCQQHITPRFTLGEIEAAVSPLHDRIAALEADNRALRAHLTTASGDGRGIGEIG